ncbi:predicted protein [Chaetoceros tenuissimus]|uniref:MYND-type domain-containing protein n=1 Tax=Chaetoceros tenuissimus TaxID=426638 RepID=A0AAD3CRN0_9STRA|nr:predicted protein [Chaetoceros tenuissimus]
MGKKGKKSKRAAAGKNVDATAIFLQNINSRVDKFSDEAEAMFSDGFYEESIEKLNDCIQIFESHNAAIARHGDKHMKRVFVCKQIIFSRIILTEFSRCNYGTVIEIYNSMRERKEFEQLPPWFQWDMDIYHELARIKLGDPCQLSPLVPTIIHILHEATLSDEAKQDLPSVEILAAIDILRSAKDFDNAIVLGKKLLDLKNDKASLSLTITFLEQYKAGKERKSNAHFPLFSDILKGLPECGIPECGIPECMLLAQLHYILRHQTSQSIYYTEMYLRRMFETGLDFCNTCSCAHTSEVQFVCSGCRSVCYCSRAHQRLTWMKDAVQGMRIGHKILCPLMKIYRKWRNATDNNEEKASRLRVKFEEACLRFLSHGLRLKDKCFE